jgi:hypothetical protein
MGTPSSNACAMLEKNKRQETKEEGRKPENRRAL